MIGSNIIGMLNGRLKMGGFCLVVKLAQGGYVNNGALLSIV